MNERFAFSPAESHEARALALWLRQHIDIEPDVPRIARCIKDALRQGTVSRDAFGLNPILFNLQTARIAVEEMGFTSTGVTAIMTHSPLDDMMRALIAIADSLNLMRQIKDAPDGDLKRRVSEEAAMVHAQQAHKLGLYKLKSELEDLSVKYLEPEAYYMIKEKLNATKASRDAYISEFIAPVESKLKEAGFLFHIKGRTKSIHSIWQKMKKQRCGFEGIYDLFAIRVILNTPNALAKTHCWQVFAIITNMYQPNPKRLRDWITVPKDNGYESLHITVLGPEQKWVEVQIRTEQMDEVAERGLAAHWRYKGVSAQEGLDEVYVFTPKGDLLKFPKGATVLDLAYRIHSKIGNRCIGAKINGRHVTLRHELQGGDTVEILTSNSQTPKHNWLSMVKTQKAKAKIRVAIKEMATKDVVYAKELFERRLKNRKLDLVESAVSHLVKRLGFKEASDFYRELNSGAVDAHHAIDLYQEILAHDSNAAPAAPARSAEEYNIDVAQRHNPSSQDDDILVIDQNLKGVDYSLSKCCSPIYGDEVFGFVTVSGGIKIHRTDCPNAAELRRRFAYRIVRAKWSGKGGATYSITLQVTGNDDIGIVNNITSVISKEEKMMMRSINIDSHDGLFRGNLTVNIEDTSRLEQLIRKLRTIKGVKQVVRL